MFGYIVVNKGELKFREFDVYHSYYCGLCRALKRRYGITGQLTLSYDMTFLLMLLTGLYEPKTREYECRCAAHPLEKHLARENGLTDYIADMNLLLSYYKCRDDWKDDRKLHRLLLAWRMEGRIRSMGAEAREKAQAIQSLLEELGEAERQESRDVDLMAGKFGRIMAQVTLWRRDEWAGVLDAFGFCLGKFIYLMDAYEDLEEDIKRGRFNPLKERFGTPQFEDEMQTILTMIMSECCRYFEELPILENAGILRNILYSGIWSRYELVRERRRREKNGAAEEAALREGRRSGEDGSAGEAAEGGAGE